MVIMVCVCVGPRDLSSSTCNFLPEADGKGDEERSRGLERRGGKERAKLKLRTQERRSDCQATCSHGNGKWRER